MPNLGAKPNGPIGWINNDYGIQYCPAPRGNSVYKIWYNDLTNGRRVVDRALSRKKARQRIKYMIDNETHGGQLFEK